MSTALLLVALFLSSSNVVFSASIFQIVKVLIVISKLSWSKVYLQYLSHLVVILVHYRVVSNQLGENNKIYLPFFALKAGHILKRTCTELNKKSVAPYELPDEKPKEKTKKNFVAYIGHPIYYGYWTTLRKYCHMGSVKLICIKRSPLFNRCSHPLDSQNAQFHYILPVYNGKQIGLRSNHEQTSICVLQSRRKNEC